MATWPRGSSPEGLASLGADLGCSPTRRHTSTSGRGRRLPQQPKPAAHRSNRNPPHGRRRFSDRSVRAGAVARSTRGIGHTPAGNSHMWRNPQQDHAARGRGRVGGSRRGCTNRSLVGPCREGVLESSEGPSTAHRNAEVFRGVGVIEVGADLLHVSIPGAGAFAVNREPTTRLPMVDIEQPLLECVVQRRLRRGIPGDQGQRTGRRVRRHLPPGSGPGRTSITDRSQGILWPRHPPGGGPPRLRRGTRPDPATPRPPQGQARGPSRCPGTPDRDTEAEAGAPAPSVGVGNGCGGSVWVALAPTRPV